MVRIKDLTGQKFGRLTVIKKVGSNKYNRTLWLCKCECGNETITNALSLKTGNTKSCGCLQKKHISQLGKASATHGLHNTRIYRIWKNIHQRCYNSNSPAYKYYGARGIKMCEEWNNNFLNFYDWSMQNEYTDSLTIDRIDVNKGYEPSNCRWITQAKQMRNTRTNKFITFNNETHCIAEWAEILKIKPYDVRKMLCKLS